MLNSLWIDNITRSDVKLDNFTINVLYNTSLKEIDKLCDEIKNLASEDDYARDFRPEFSYVIDSINDFDKLTLTVIIKYKSSWHDDQSQATRRSRFMRLLIEALNRVSIHGPNGGIVVSV